MNKEEIRLTQYSHGAGCGCKISPDDLSKVLASNVEAFEDKRLIVGNTSRDDAAVFDLGDGTAIISTTDFFMPIVDDPFTFGKIAAANAISDIYAMGGTPLVAIAILGWPMDKLSPEVASVVLDGGRAVCREAGIALAGGHSIDSPEPIFGLAVTGKVRIDQLKRNDTATEGCRLYLTKPLGVGILATAQKRGILKAEHSEIAPINMMKLNSVGRELASIKGVKAMTDVTGFGFLGHLLEICEGSGLSARVDYSKIPVIDCLQEYIDQGSMPGATRTNWKSVEAKVALGNPEWRKVLCDPQTSGGLLVAVEEHAAGEVESLFKALGIDTTPIGLLTPESDTVIEIVSQADYSI